MALGLGGPLVDLLANTPEANRAVAKPDEVGRVSCAGLAGSGLGWSLLGLMLQAASW